MVERSYGGVSLSNPIKGVPSFFDRAHKCIREKRIIAKKAASLLKGNQSILLDSSSTAAFLLPYIAKLKGVTVFSNNLSTVLNAIELGIDTHCLGGKSVNGSVALSSVETYRLLSNISTDILFFSSQSLNEKGLITDSSEEENYARSLMLMAAEKAVFLCDSSKFKATSRYGLCNINDIDFAVFDSEYIIKNAKCRFL